MAIAKDEAPARRYLVLGALLGLNVVSAVAFARVFRGREPALKLALAAAASTLLAFALERRHVLLATAASMAGLAFAVGLAVFPQTTAYGLPTLHTWRMSRTALEAITAAANSQVAPALPLPPILLATLAATWLAAFAAHVLAARSKSPFLAICPPVALLAFAGLVRDDGARPGYLLPFLAFALALLFADGLSRVAQWGPVTEWHGRRRRFASATTTRAARRVAIATLGIAALAPWVMPGFGNRGILRVQSEDTAVSINPFVDMRPALLDQPRVELFTVRSSHGSYWRFLALDRFDGRTWTTDAVDPNDGMEGGSGPIPAADSAVSVREPTILVRHRIRITRLNQVWLPTAPHAAAISLENDVPLRFDPVGNTVMAPNGSFPGFSYTAVSRIPVPKPEDLDELVSLPPRADLLRYTRLPRMPGEILRIAHRLTRGAETPYQKALAIQDHLRTFRYNERAPAGHDTNDLLFFLQKSQEGYCEQFAGAMAVLLRALGVPARVALGFTPGTLDTNGVYRVSSKNAHAWVEVLFPGYGWLAFEPTPTRSNPAAISYTVTGITTGLGQRIVGSTCLTFERLGCERGGSSGVGGSQDGTRGEGPDATQEPPVAAMAGGRAQVPPPPPEPLPLRLLKLGIVLLALVAAAIPLSKMARRRLALRAAATPPERVLTAFRVMTEEARDVGLGRLGSETLGEYRARLKARVETLNGDLDRLTSLAGMAAYARDGIGEEDAERAVASARTVTGEIRRWAGPRRRLLGLFRVDLPTRG